MLKRHGLKSFSNYIYILCTYRLCDPKQAFKGFVKRFEFFWKTISLVGKNKMKFY